MQQCIDLISIDYDISVRLLSVNIFSIVSVLLLLYFKSLTLGFGSLFQVVSNSGGELSAHYPSSLIVLEKERIHTLNRQDVRLRQSDTIYESASESVTESTRLRDLISKARLARCRARFPLPVILYQGKHICRYLFGGAAVFFSFTLAIEL